MSEEIAALRNLASEYTRAMIRASAVEAWRSAADRAEEFATLYERLDTPISGPEALRRMAEAFRLVAGDLDVLPSPSAILATALGSPPS